MLSLQQQLVGHNLKSHFVSFPSVGATEWAMEVTDADLTCMNMGVGGESFHFLASFDP